MHLWEMRQSTKSFKSHADASQRTSKEVLNNQIDRMLELNASSPLTSAIPAQFWPHKWSKYRSRNRGYAKKVGSLSPLPLPTTKADLANPAAECLTCQPNIPMLSPQYTTVPQGNLPLTGKLMISYPSILERASIHSDWNCLIFQVWIFFSCLQFFSQSYH